MNIYFEKYFQISFSFFATGLKHFKAPFHKKIWKIPEVFEISKNQVLRKFPDIQHIHSTTASPSSNLMTLPILIPSTLLTSKNSIFAPLW